MQYKKTMAFYIRLSSEDIDLKSSDKGESNSISNQRKLLRDYVDSQPSLKEYEITEFCDDGYTGTNFNRPQFIKMIEAVRKREIHCIIVKDLSRFGREYLEVGAYLELILPLFGTRFISVNDAFDSNDYIGTTGGLELALRNLINGMYSKDLSVKIRSSIKTRSRRGEYLGGASFYGYQLDPQKKHMLIVDENVCETVERIFDECIAEKSASQIAKGLNDDQIPCPAAYKRQKGNSYHGRTMEYLPYWTPTTVLRILTDERYTGKMVSNRRETVGVSTNKTHRLPKEDWIIVDGTHEAIISKEKFDLAAESLKSRMKNVNKNTAGYKDNLFVCGHCGRRLQKSKGQIPHLYCPKAKISSDGACSEIDDSLDQMQNCVLATLKRMAQVFVERSVIVRQGLNSEIPLLQKKITEAQRAIQRLQAGKLDLYEEYRQGKISRDRFVLIQEKRQSEQDGLTDDIKRYESLVEQIEKRRSLIEDTHKTSSEILLLNRYEAKIIGKLVDKVRLYGNGRMEIDLLTSDELVLFAFRDANFEV